MEGELRFTIHARARLVRWHVTEEEVREALADVRRRRIDPAPVLVWGRTRGGRRLKIVLDREDPRWVVTLVAQGEGA